MTETGFSESVFALIKKRKSWRNYEAKEIDGRILEKIKAFLVLHHTGPFGNRCRFEVIEVLKEHARDLKRFNTYGIIRGARTFIAGAVSLGTKGMLDYGYCLEKVILFAVQEGLGTCWLGGTFDRSNFGRAMGLQPHETLPAITPIGSPVTKKSLIDKTMRVLAGSDHRKRWEEVFFDKEFGRPLPLQNSSAIAEVLEMVRLAPSASNKQPWRIVMEDKNVFHFYLQRSKILKAYRLKADLQLLDMGIALCHFDLCVKEKGMAGKWTMTESRPAEDQRYEYMASWVPDSHK